MTWRDYLAIAFVVPFVIAWQFRRALAVLALAAALAALSWAALATPVDSPLAYLVEPRAAGSTALLQAADPLVSRRVDRGSHGRDHWQAVVPYLAPDGSVVVAKDTVPLGAFALPHDGGDRYVIDLRRGSVRAASTRDGGTGYEQHFVGARCGGDGWLLWDSDILTNVWTWKLARLSMSSDPNACPPLGEALTAYSHGWIDLPDLGVTEVVVSVHFAGATWEGSDAAEIFVFGRGVGPVVWLAHRRTASTLADIPDPRCGADFGYHHLSGFHLTDCRIWTRRIDADGALTAGDLWAPGK